MIISFINLGIFSILLNYLIMYGFRTLVIKNIFLMIIMTSGIIIIGFLIAAATFILVKEYFLTSEYVVGKFLPKQNRSVIEVETVHDGRIFD